MTTSMRLFLRNGVYHVEFHRHLRRSLKTRNKPEADGIFRNLCREWRKGRLLPLEPCKKVTLAQFTTEYLKERQPMALCTYRMDALSLRLLSDVVHSSTLLRSISPKKIDEFKRICLARGCKPQSVNSYLRHIKAALGVAMEWYPGYKRPKIKMCKTGKTLPRVLDPGEIDFLLRVAVEFNFELWRLMVFYLWTGARRNEALGLRWQNVKLDCERPYCKVVGKGDKERIVPLLEPVTQSFRPYQQDIGRVFTRRHPSTVSHWFLTLVRECEIKARLHDLRHTAATYMLAKGIDIRYVQEILGHAQLCTTQIYTHVIPGKLYDEMTKLRFE